MKTLFFPLLLPLFAGCLSAHVPTVADWNVSADLVPRSREAPSFGAARLSQVVVSTPYDAREMQVSRSDGTLAADAYNLFAAAPSRLLREPARAILEATGRFKAVVGASSSASVSHVVEVTVTDLRLDCSQDAAAPGRREAVVEVRALVLDRDRNLAGLSRGAFRADARDGDFGAAFSKAFSRALGAAVAGL